jgi:hypothetical protein
MKMHIEKSFINFLKQNKKIVFIAIILPLLISYTYYSIYKPCHTIHKIQTRNSSVEVNYYFEQIFFQLKDNKSIKFSNLSMPFIEFKGRAFECTENFQNVKKIINDVNLYILNDVKNSNKEIKALSDNIRLEKSLPLNSIYELEKIQIYKNLGADSSAIELFEKFGLKYTVISILDLDGFNNAKIIFSLTFGSLILSLLIIFTIFFYKHLFRKF